MREETLQPLNAEPLIKEESRSSGAAGAGDSKAKENAMVCGCWCSGWCEVMVRRPSGVTRCEGRTGEKLGVTEVEEGVVGVKEGVLVAVGEGRGQKSLPSWVARVQNGLLSNQPQMENEVSRRNRSIV